jgi:hypothetical protein
MKVSRNELIASLKKAFEGLGFEPGDYYDAADMVVWLETHGFYGFDRLLATLGYLNTTGPVYAELVQEDSHKFLMDGKGTSILLCGSEAVDLIRAEVTKGKSAKLEVINCYNRTFIIQRLVKAAQRGFAFIAYWRQLDYCVKVAVGPSDLLPQYSTHNFSGELDQQSLKIFCGDSLDNIEEQYARELEFGSRIDDFSASQMEECYKNSLEYGIEIDEALWFMLDELVARVLVESTDLSRAGAGD